MGRIFSKRYATPASLGKEKKLGFSALQPKVSYWSYVGKRIKV